MRLKNNFSNAGSDISFKEADIKKIRMMDSGPLFVISTVCPDYPNNGQKYTFSGTLGDGVSLAAKEHLYYVPRLLENLTNQGFKPEWIMLVADLPEMVKSQQVFYEKAAGNAKEYLARCARSARAIQEKAGDQALVKTFSNFYQEAGLDYLDIQNQVSVEIRKAAGNQPFGSKFHSFAMSRASLAMKFRGSSSLSEEEILEAGSHGMSLYITHGTLLRKIFIKKNFIVINHRTPNLQNFYLCNLVPGYQNLIDTPKFPLGILEKDLY